MNIYLPSSQIYTRCQLSTSPSDTDRQDNSSNVTRIEIPVAISSTRSLWPTSYDFLLDACTK